MNLNKRKTKYNYIKVNINTFSDNLRRQTLNMVKAFILEEKKKGNNSFIIYFKFCVKIINI